jgi:hypothetical protein
MQNAEALARTAGLERAWAEHRADVEAAITNAATLRAGFARPQDVTTEPMPAYCVANPKR